MLRRATAGFTLYELLAVMVLMAILAGTVALSVRGRVSNAGLESFLVQIELCDARARSEARRWNQPVLLGFDSSDQRVWQSAASVDRSSVERSIAAPRGVKISQIKTMNRQLDQGTLQIAISPLGQSDTYALRIQASGGRDVWLVVLGGSGQVLRFDTEGDVDGVFSLQGVAIGNDAR
jgi:prepilin-type N-terminal cleavage/methylation domain-containing protein